MYIYMAGFCFKLVKNQQGIMRETGLIMLPSLVSFVFIVFLPYPLQYWPLKPFLCAVVGLVSYHELLTYHRIESDLICVCFSFHKTLTSSRWSWRKVWKASALASEEGGSTRWTCLSCALQRMDQPCATGEWGYEFFRCCCCLSKLFSPLFKG